VALIDLVQGLELLLIQLLVAELAVETLDVAVLHGFLSGCNAQALAAEVVDRTGVIDTNAPA
jgi:hypothetical protein